MNFLANINTEATITSLQLVEIINKFRLEEGDRAVLAHSDFLKILRAEFAEEIGLGIISCTYYKDCQNKDRPMFDLNFKQAIILLNRESKSVRRKTADYIEKTLSDHKVDQTPAIPQTYAQALRAAADMAERLELAKPKVEFVNNYVEANGSKSFREVAKILGIKEKIFIQFLIDEKLIYRQSGKLLPYAKSNGIFEVKTGTAGDFAFAQTRITPKGIAKIAQKITASEGGC